MRTSPGDDPTSPTPASRETRWDRRWLVVRDHRQLLVSVDNEAPLSDDEGHALADFVSSKLRLETVDEVVLIGLKRFDDTRLGNFHDVVRAVGTLANAAGKPFRIAH